MNKLECPNCNHSEIIEKMNYRKDSKIYMAKLYLVQKENPDLVVNTFICFACNHLTNFAGNADGTVEYFETYKYDKDVKFDNYYDIHGERNKFDAIKRMIIDINFDNNLDHFVKRLDKL